MGALLAMTVGGHRRGLAGGRLAQGRPDGGHRWAAHLSLQASLLGWGKAARSSHSCGPAGLTLHASPGPSLRCQPCLPHPCGAHCTHRALSCLQRTHRGFTFLEGGGGARGVGDMTVARREGGRKQRNKG